MICKHQKENKLSMLSTYFSCARAMVNMSIPEYKVGEVKRKMKTSPSVNKLINKTLINTYI